jgi:protein-disulfide isomerase
MRMKAMILLLLCFSVAQVGQAQAQNGLKDRGDLAALRKDIKSLQAEQQQILSRLDELRQILQSNSPPVTSVSVHDAIFRGDSTARVAIIEYADFECPYCGQYERSTFPQILSDYIATGKVKYFYRDLPLPEHARAMPAARAARCAGEQGKYWEMHDSLFAKQTALSAPALLDRAKTLGLDTTKFTDCQSSDKYETDIQKNIAEAQQMRIDGTPTFVLGIVGPNGDVKISKKFAGTAPYDVFKGVLDELLAEAR